MRIREANKKDIPKMKKLFKETILEINKKDYSENQVNDWASCGEDESSWETKLTKFKHFVCEHENQIVGFCAINKSGFINSMFVSKNHQRKSIGKEMMQKIIDYASTNSIKKLKSEVSITAKPFFESFGFKVIMKQEVKANKLTLSNYVMEKKDMNTSKIKSKSSISKVDVVILNGFLGSGKTTLFRNLLSQAKKKNIPVCAVVNDMSELDVDGELISNTDVVEENNEILVSIPSCVLSSKQGIKKLDASIKKLFSKQSPELIIIETSGSCHPLPLVEYFKSQEKVKLTGLFTLVDSLMLAHDYHYGETLIPKMQENLAQGKRDTVNLLVEQIMFCSHLILTKADRIEKEKLPDIATYIQNINPNVSTHSVHFGKLNIDALFEIPEYNYFQVAQLTEELRTVLDNQENEDKPYDLATRVIKDERPFHPQRLWDACHNHLDQGIYRSKGFFWLSSRNKYSLLWNQAAGSISLELIGSWRAGILEDENHGLLEFELELLKQQLAKEKGRFGDRRCDLTVIGDQSKVDRFTDALTSCFLTEDEIKLWEEGYEFPDPWPKRIVKLTD